MKPAFLILTSFFLVSMAILVWAGGGEMSSRTAAALLFTVAYCCLAILKLRVHQRARKKQKRHAFMLASALRNGALNQPEPAGEPRPQCVME